MTITSELNTLQTNLSNAYDAIEEKGGTLPANKNMNNLADSIANIPEANYTLMGNELRRAYCWSRTENLNGMCQLYDCQTGKFSSAFQATTVKICECFSSNNIDYNNTYSWKGWVIIDGRLYTLSLSTSGITMTQKGTGIGWESTNNSVFVRNGKVYYGYSNAENETPPLMDAIDFKILASPYSTDGFINNGKVYYSTTQRNSSHTNVKKICNNFWGNNYYYLIKDGNYIYKLNVNNTSGTKIFDGIVTNDALICDSSNVVFFVDKTLYCYSTSYSSSSCSLRYNNTFEYSIKDIRMCNSGIRVILNDGSMYYNNQAYTKSFTKINITNVNKFINSYNFTKNSCHVLTNDNKIYNVTTLTPSLVYTFSTNVTNIDDASTPWITCFKFTEDEIQIHKLYTTQYIDEITKSYNSNFSEGCIEYNISSKTTDTITVNSEVYNRDGLNDLIFDFIPEDLDNHIFSDTDLIEAYLDAGIQQGNG